MTRHALLALFLLAATAPAESATGLAWVADERDASIGAIDTASLAAVATLALPAGQVPHAVLVDD